jgi:glycosyltransferase involved in cell wall biosynthesis
MRLGIDASNLRDGGGVTHLTSVLCAANPPAHGISKVVVWGPRKTLAGLPVRPWLQASEQSPLEGSLVRRVIWQRFALPKLARTQVDLLWIPGGNAVGAPHPFVTMCRNMLPFEPGERRRYGATWMRFRLAVLARAQARTFRRGDGVIFLTAYARGRILERVGRLDGETATIPHGVAERFRRAPRPQRPAELFSGSSPFRLLGVSVIDVYKHQWVLADAVARLRAKGLPIALDLIGGAYAPALGQLREVLERVDPAGRAIRYLGQVPFAKLHEHYHAADAFVFASSCENLPNILLEAMASGLPIACSDRGPMPEVLGDAGVYFNPEDVSSSAAAIERLFVSHDVRQRCAEAAYRRAASYTWKRCADETMTFLGRVGSKSRTGR